MIEENVIPNSFDDFINPQVQATPTDITEKDTLVTRFTNERLQWSAKVKDLSENFKSILKTGELQTVIYTERQRALEYYHYLISLLIKINKTYRKIYAEKYDFYSWKSQKRFPNETTKNNQILSEMEELVEKREMIENHSKFCDGVLKTLDQVIFGIKSRIDFENIARGK